MIEPEKLLDLDGLVQAHLRWEIDPDDFCWFRADLNGDAVFLRINPKYPDVPLYSLLIGPGELVDLEELPRNWERTDELVWPPTARGR